MRVRKKLMALLLVLSASCGSITREEFDGKIANLEGRISQLEERQRILEERNFRVETRLDTISESLSRTRLEIERLRMERQSTPPQPVTKLPAPPREEPAPQPEKPEESYQRDYDEALRLYNLRQLNQAKDRFIDFIKKYPRTPLTDNAYLWLGVVYRDLGELNKAEAVWLTLVERCQRKEMVDCNKAPSAMLQLARLYEQRGDSQRAREFYEAILRDYPLSEEANIARTKLGR